MQRRSTVGDLIPIDLEINATCRRRNQEIIRKFLQDLEAAAIPKEEPQSSKASSNPQGMYSPLSSLNLVDSTTQVDVPSTCTTKDVPSNVLRQRSQAVKPLILWEWGYKRILRRLEKGDTKEFRRLVLCSFGKGRRETQKEFRRLQDVSSIGELMNLDVVSLLKNKPLMKLITWEISPETILLHEDFQNSNMASNTINNMDNGGTTVEINSIEIKVDHPQGHSNKGLLEETLAQFMQVSMSNQKSTESAIKKLEVQVGQLAKQLADRSSSSFTANIEKNPKEECKVVMTRSKMAIHVDESEAEMKMEEHKQQLEPKPALEPVSDFVELEEINEEVEDDKMASRKKKTPSTPTQARFDRSRFTSQEAWERYTDIVVPRKILPERNVVVYYTEFEEFKEELERRHWDEELTDFLDDNIDVAIVKEFYANLYDPEDKSPKRVRVRGHVIKFDEDTLNTFLKTPVVMEEGEKLCAYFRFALLRPDPQELATKLYIPGRGFELNADGQPLKILRKNMTTLAQTWSVLSFSNLIPTSHTSDVTLDRAKLIYGIIMKMDMNMGYLISHQISLIAQHDTSRLGFPALITALCKARGVQSNSRSLESLSPAINLAYIKKNCWNFDDPIVTFRGPRKVRGKRSEVPTTSAPETLASSSTTAPLPPIQTPVIPPTPTQIPLPAPLSAGPLDFLFTPQMLHSMLQSIHRGQSTIMQSLQGLGLPSILSMEEFEAQPSTLVVESKQLIQDSSVAPTLDLNEHQPQEDQDVKIFAF
ncbi:hypothetical protein HKD37_17G048091 [Glycine soja]